MHAIAPAIMNSFSRSLRKALPTSGLDTTEARLMAPMRIPISASVARNLLR